MLDVTTGTNINHGQYCGLGAGLGIMDEAAELLLDEEIMMDPLFEEDWLHENNLDILFDLFEEEIESKISGDSNNGSSTLFGTSPVTSYLFGTSPSLASALDLIYFDNQPATGSAASATNKIATTTTTTTTATTTTTINPTLATSTAVTAVTAATTATTTITTSAAASSKMNTSAAQTIANIISTATPINQASNHKTISAYNIVNGKKNSHRSNNINGVQSIAQASSSSNKSISAYNIANGTKTTHRTNINSVQSDAQASDNSPMRIKRGLKKGQCEGTSLLAKPGRNKNVSEKYYPHKCQQHIHYITGRAVIREHAYAVRGH
jgi:hypothetical protein